MSHEPPPTRADQRQQLAGEYAEIAVGTQLRVRPVIDSSCGRTIVLHADGKRLRLRNWAGNDYLGALGRRKVQNGAFRMLRRYGPGAGAARLLAGGLRPHRSLEQRLAGYLGAEEALLTTTGYQANIAAVGALVGPPEDVVILDRLCHASLYDAAKLSGASLLRFRHNDAEDLERQLQRSSGARRRLVCVESVYSMDGDEAPLAAIDALCSTHGALLLVDEAHALGVLGGGRGLCRELGIQADLRTATCSKALGSQGGIIAGDRDLVELCVNRGRSFLFSTAPVPAAVGAASGMIDVLRAEPTLPDDLLRRSAALRAALTAQGWKIPAGRSPIIPLIVGDEVSALALAARLRLAGHYAPAIRPPTVPAGESRLRITVTLAHTESDVRKLLAALGSAPA